ncbi:MAG: hypothetical protein R3F59_16035 [Myxococcota bacterium]
MTRHPATAARRAPFLLAISALLTACDGGKGDETAEPSLEEYACLHIAEGSVVDVALDRADAHTIDVGRAPYRVNLYPGEAGYLQFETAGAADLTLLLDFAGAVPAVWTGEDRTELTPDGADDVCPDDIAEVLPVSVGGGTHWLEVGPAFQGNVWMMLAE